SWMYSHEQCRHHAARASASGWRPGRYPAVNEPPASMTRDARPFLAHHLRENADTRLDRNGDALHDLARWVENLPADDPTMRRIALTDALDYADGCFVCGAASRALVRTYQEDTSAGREAWLGQLAEAVEHVARARRF